MLFRFLNLKNAYISNGYTYISFHFKFENSSQVHRLITALWGKLKLHFAALRQKRSAAGIHKAEKRTYQT